MKPGGRVGVVIGNNIRREWPWKPAAMCMRAFTM